MTFHLGALLLHCARGIVVGGVAVSTCACSMWAALTFSEAEGTGKDSGEVLVALIPSGTAPPEDRRTDEEKKQDQNLWELLKKANLPSGVGQSCGVPEVRLTDAVFLPVIAKLVFDLFLDAGISSVEELKAKAEPEAYGATIIVGGKDLYKNKCLLIARTTENNAPTFLALLQIEPHGSQSFTLLPVYVRATTSVAVASKATPQMNAAFAIAIKSVGLTQTKDATGANLPAVVLVGEGSTSIAGIKIGTDAEPHCVKNECARTDLIARPPDNVENVMVRVAVAEVGKTGINMDTALAELRAVKEAIGPALSERVKARYSD